LANSPLLPPPLPLFAPSQLPLTLPMHSVFLVAAQIKKYDQWLPLTLTVQSLFLVAAKSKK
jgi:hypothetical protein